MFSDTGTTIPHLIRSPVENWNLGQIAKQSSRAFVDIVKIFAFRQELFLYWWSRSDLHIGGGTIKLR